MDPPLALGHIGWEGTVDSEGNPVCKVRATCADRLVNPVILEGAMTPSEVRALAVQMFEVAEGTEQDAVILKTLEDLGVEADLVTAIITRIREVRPSYS